MQIQTTRFDTVEIEADDIINFPNGMMGLEDCRHWVLLADAENDALGWLQSTSLPEMAFAVVCPRRFVVDYPVRVSRGELFPLAFTDVRDAHVLSFYVIGQRGITLLM